MPGLFALAREIQGFPPQDPPKYVAIPGDPQPIHSSLATEVLHPVIKNSGGCEIATLDIIGKETSHVALLRRNDQVIAIQGQAADRRGAISELRRKLCTVTPRHLRLIRDGKTIVLDRAESRRLCHNLRTFGQQSRHGFC